MRQAGHVDRQDESHFAQANTANEFLEAVTLCYRRAAQPEIGVNHVDGRLTPSEFASALAKRILKAQAFLIAYDLVGRRLPGCRLRLCAPSGLM
ncbi:hypothetical protein ACM43_09655 [Bradyrhizobium sp. CCBAU 45321]|nr:hypothetical protein [Bradyrhizobium sp. CCBAU 45321]